MGYRGTGSYHYIKQGTCEVCKVEFTYNSNHKTGKFCGKECYWKSKRGGSSWNKGKSWSDDWKTKRSDARLGKSFITPEGRQRLSEAGKRRAGETHKRGWKRSVDDRRKKSEAHLARLGGPALSRIRKQFGRIFRDSFEYSEWRRKIFERDGRSCIKCHSRRKVQTDHIKPLYAFPELALVVNNGQLLCSKCHSEKTKLDCQLYPRPNVNQYKRRKVLWPTESTPGKVLAPLVSDGEVQIPSDRLGS